MAEPRHRRGASRQDYGTPIELINAVKARLGITEFAIDLAASSGNAKADRYFTEADNSLVQDWAAAINGGWAWLNPPYANITPWVKKASTSGVNIAMLIPASVGSNWWRDWVHERAEVWFLNGRVQFEGAPTHSPKDHAVLLYSDGSEGVYDVWTWK